MHPVHAIKILAAAGIVGAWFAPAGIAKVRLQVYGLALILNMAVYQSHHHCGRWGSNLEYEERIKIATTAATSSEKITEATQAFS
jgi:hypothetical protein